MVVNSKWRRCCVRARGDGLWDRPAHGRAPARRRADLELTADRADAVAHPDQTVAVVPLRVVDSHSIITDREMDSIPVTTDGHANAYVAARVLDRVLDRLRRAEIDRRLDRRRAASDARIGDGDRDRCASSQVSAERSRDRRFAVRADRCRAPGCAAPRPPLRRRRRSPRAAPAIRSSSMLLLRHPQLDLDRHQPLLRAVMKIALEPTALVIGGLHDPQARCAQLVEQAYVLDQHQRGRRQALDGHRSRYRALDRGSERRPGRCRLVMCVTPRTCGSRGSSSGAPSTST